MIKKIIIVIILLAVLAAGGYFAMNYLSKNNGKADVPAVPAAKPNTNKAMDGVAASERAASAAKPTVVAVVQAPSDSDASNSIAAGFAAQRDIPKTAAAVSSGEELLSLRDILSGKKVLSIPLYTIEDPTLSNEDRVVAERARRMRMQAEEASRQARAEAERREQLRREAEERELEAQRRDPSRAVRNKIKISGIVAQEVFIGGSVYKVGDTVLGARIVSISDDIVRFSYKGQIFTKKIEVK